MKIERQLVPVSTLEQFAYKHDLTMQVFERRTSTVAMPHVGPCARFYAHFKHAEIGENGMLLGAFGNGATEDEAIANYAKEISERKLVINAGTESRREIEVPRLEPVRDKEIESEQAVIRG